MQAARLFAMLTKRPSALRSLPLLETSSLNRSAKTRSLHHLSKPLLRTRIPTASRIHRTAQAPSTTSRFASTSQELATDARSLGTRLKNLVLGSAIGIFLVIGYYYVTDTRAGIHQWVVVPSLRWIYDDAEEAHEVGTKALKGLYDFGLHPRERGNEDAVGDLQVEVRSGHLPKQLLLNLDCMQGLRPRPFQSHRYICWYRQARRNSLPPPRNRPCCH